MSDDNDRVSYIRYCVQDQWVASYIDPVRFRFEESIEKFVQLCERELRREFPGVEDVVVSRDTADGVPAAEKTTLVYSWQDDGTDREETELAHKIDLLCEGILRRYDWLVAVNRIQIASCSTYCEGLHPAVARWGCLKGLIEDADREAGIWTVPLRAVSDFGRRFQNSEWHSIRPDEAFRLLVWEDIGNPGASQIDETTSIVLASRNGFGHALTTPNASYFLLNRSDSGICIRMEHFVDVEPWSYSSWSYSTYCNQLEKFASQCGFTYQPRRSEGKGGSAVHGFILERVEELNASDAICDIVDKWIRRFSELADITEVSLAGGPVWSDVHEKDEARFRTEILDPLLRKMKFRSVHYTHGPRGEHGRDFVMVYEAGFHEVMYIGLQAKTGDIRGKSSSMIRELIEQIDDALTVKYPISEPGMPLAEAYISCVIVAVSGVFTEDARKKIRDRLETRQNVRGRVFFWDKHKIRSLISNYWGRSQE